jgi:hypothetical protein
MVPKSFFDSLGDLPQNPNLIAGLSFRGQAILASRFPICHYLNISIAKNMEQEIVSQ